MPLDGVFLNHLKKELEEKLIGSIVDKINQPEKNEFVFTFRTKESQALVLMSANAQSARVCITHSKTENPKTPYMLCMLFRKKLIGAKLIGIRQTDFERVIFFDFLAKNNVADEVNLTLCVEIMGKYSNIILIDDTSTVIDSVKRVDSTKSSKRIILPHKKYVPVPAQDKLCPLYYTNDEIKDMHKSSGLSVSKFMFLRLQGISPQVSKECEKLIENRNMDFSNILDIIKNAGGKPYAMFNEHGEIIDFSFINFECSNNFKEYDTFSELLDDFYAKKDLRERIRSKTADIHKLLTNIKQRLSNKISLQTTELNNCKDREKYKVFADILNANIYRIPNKQDFIILENFYEDPVKNIEIKLDSKLTASQNAQKYYKEYRKLSTGENILIDQIKSAKEELKYIESLLFYLDNIETQAEIEEFLDELTKQNYIKHNTGKKTNITKSKPSYLEFMTNDNSLILVGKNNKENDKLTLKRASKSDMWFHAKDLPGSHTILVTEGKEPSQSSILEAAEIAAYYSKADKYSKVGVDYTYVKNVSKPNGAKPGMVIYVNYKTIYVTPKIGKSPLKSE